MKTANEIAGTISAKANHLSQNIALSAITGSIPPGDVLDALLLGVAMLTQGVAMLTQGVAPPAWGDTPEARRAFVLARLDELEVVTAKLEEMHRGPFRRGPFQ